MFLFLFFDLKSVFGVCWCWSLRMESRRFAAHSPRNHSHWLSGETFLGYFTLFRSDSCIFPPLRNTRTGSEGASWAAAATFRFFVWEKANVTAVGSNVFAAIWAKFDTGSMTEQTAHLFTHFASLLRHRTTFSDTLRLFCCVLWTTKTPSQWRERSATLWLKAFKCANIEIPSTDNKLSLDIRIRYVCRDFVQIADKL